MFTLFIALATLVAAAIWSWHISDHPRFAFGLALAVLILVPVWAEFRGLSTPLPPFSVACILLLPAIFRQSRLVFNAVDIALIIFTILALAAPSLGHTPSYASGTVVAQWIPAYLVGRLLVQRVGLRWAYRAVAISGGIVGVWAIVEFMFSWHVFQDFTGTPGAVTWQVIQVRGSFERSEAAFGHAIAMGGFLSLTVPFVIAADMRSRWRTILLILTALGCLTSFSRGPIIGYALAVVLSSIFMGSSGISRRYLLRLRAAVLVIGPVAAIWVTNLFAGVSDDLSVSTAYRAQLPEFIRQDFSWYGISDNFIGNQYGQFFYRSFTSIDNAYILIGLQFGWIPLLLLAGGLVAFLVRTLAWRAAPAAIALVPQIFVLGTVALITQYSSAVWMVVGIAAAEIAVQRDAKRSVAGQLPRRWPELRDLPERRVDLRRPKPASPSPER